MVWPTGYISTANLDAGSDRISSAREDLLLAVERINEIIATGGIEGNIISNVASVNGQVGVVTLVTANIAEAGSNFYFSEERAQDSTANLFAAGSHSGITFTYNDAAGSITANVTGNLSGSFVDLTTTQSVGGDKTFTGLTTLNEYVEAVYDGGSVSGAYTPTLTNGPVHKILLTGSFSLAPPSGMTSGSSITVIIRQDSTGSRAMTANAAYKFAAGVNTLSSAANSRDILAIFYDGTDYLATLSKGYV